MKSRQYQPYWTSAEIDAMGCQKKIAELIVSKQADYIFGLKGNQETLSLGAYVAFNPEEKCAEPSIFTQKEEKNHGRKENRTCRVLPVSALPKFAAANPFSRLIQQLGSFFARIFHRAAGRQELYRLFCTTQDGLFPTDLAFFL